MSVTLSLLCLPCAGASASMYLRWRRLLPRWIEVHAVELPGRGARLGEPFVEDFGQLVAKLCIEQDAALRGNFALFGHSMGALLAHGITRRLRALGRPLPRAVVASGSPAPTRREDRHFPAKHDDAGLIADLRRQGGTPEEVFASEELMRITLDALGADYRVCESFSRGSGTHLPVPLHVLAGRDDDIAPERVEAWSIENVGPFTLDWFDGGHFFIREHEPLVVATLAQRLAQSCAPESLAHPSHHAARHAVA
ncbi:thioesterase II family protein [Cupriavidus numazuensis]|uniref:Thioesterase PikA5 n=1 Tax=Cupriavidus numazuensis TaxID=221992 RepID=A0ABM8TVQ0_9BURK|nr:alpha/beta fold hydrolase [Cupriavidus numazuensis]CAG2160778.1 Thioesterase PikA5 [Cupriavidus numazuensis]